MMLPPPLPPMPVAIVTPAAPDCAVESLVPSFARFAAETAALAAPLRAERFMAEYLPAHRAYYLVPGLPGDTAAIRALAERFFAGDGTRAGLRAPDAEGALVAGAALAAALPAIQRRFTDALPDFRCDATLVLGVSLGRFDALADRSGKRTRLLFGVDTIARVHDAASAAALVDHELFHLYQNQVAPAQPADPIPLWWGMWLEGSAIYAAGTLNPALPLQALLAYPPDLALRGAIRRREIARALLADLDATGPGYARWFTADIAPPGGLPPRAAYYMGYRLAERLGRTRSLATLARLRPAEVRAAAEAFLRAEAGA